MEAGEEGSEGDVGTERVTSQRLSHAISGWGYLMVSFRASESTKNLRGPIALFCVYPDSRVRFMDGTYYRLSVRLHSTPSKPHVMYIISKQIEYGVKFPFGRASENKFYRLCPTGDPSLSPSIFTFPSDPTAWRRGLTVRPCPREFLSRASTR